VVIDELESDLRAALAQHAAEVPAAAAARLCRLDYHPRTSRVRPQLALGALAGVAGTAGVIVSIIGLGAGAQDAFAGWTAAPSPVSSAQLAADQTVCESDLAANTTPAPFSTSQLTGWHAVLTDTRGPFSYLIMQTGDYHAACFSGPNFTRLGEYGYAIDSSQRAGADQAPADAIVTESAGTVLLAPDGQPYDGNGPIGSQYGQIDGSTGPGVTAVTLVLDDGTRVEATAANGWFAAWWPGPQRAPVADLTTSTGTVTQQLLTPSGLPCGPTSCADPTGPPGTGNTGTGSTDTTGVTATTSNTGG
jgi:hypothetical protein